MAAEVENPPVTTEEKQEEAPAPAAEAPVEEAAKEAAPAAEEVKEAPVVKEAAPKKPTVFKQNFEKDVVYLYQFARTTSLPSLSPYVLKVETWLRLVGLKYEVSLKCITQNRKAWFDPTKECYSKHPNTLVFVNPEYFCMIAWHLIGINWIWSNDPQSHSSLPRLFVLYFLEII